MPLNPSGAISLAGPVAGQSIAVELGQSATATISLNDTVVRTLGGVASGQISLNTFWGKSNITATQRAVFSYGETSPNGRVLISNQVSSTGVVATDTPGVGTARQQLLGVTYGGDKGLFAFGNLSPSPGARFNIVNLVSNTGVISADNASAPTVGALSQVFGAGYGGDKAISAYGRTNTVSSRSNLISNTGVIAADTPGVGTARQQVAAVGYGGDKAVFAYGFTPFPTNTNFTIANYVSNTGVIAGDTPIAGSGRNLLSAAVYGGDKGIIGYGIALPANVNITNLVSNTGVIAADTPGVGTARNGLAASGFGGDRAIFGFGFANPSTLSMTNLVSNTGVVANDAPGVGTARRGLAAAGFSATA